MFFYAKYFKENFSSTTLPTTEPTQIERPIAMLTTPPIERPIQVAEGQIAKLTQIERPIAIKQEELNSDYLKLLGNVSATGIMKARDFIKEDGSSLSMPSNFKVNKNKIDVIGDFTTNGEFIVKANNDDVFKVDKVGNVGIRRNMQVIENVDIKGDFTANGEFIVKASGRETVFKVEKNNGNVGIRGNMQVNNNVDIGGNMQVNNNVDIRGNVKTNNLVINDGLSMMNDTRGINSPPSFYRDKAKLIGKGVKFAEFKANNTIFSVTAKTVVDNGHSYVETIVPWDDTTGGRVKQIAYTDYRLMYRVGSVDDTTWESWK